MSETVSYEEAAQTALDAALMVEYAYVSVLAEEGIHEDDITAIQKRVRELIRESMNG